MRSTYLKRGLVPMFAVVGFAIAYGGGIALAHVDPDPLAVEAGSTATIGFKIEHGCDGSPTTSLEFKVPPEVTNVKPVDKAGWTANFADGVVTFAGGPLPPEQEDHFDITLTAPTKPGEVRFPAIQKCEKGELAWIEIPTEGAAEPEHPAPTLKITAGPPTAADLAAAEEAGADAAPTASVAPVVAADSPSSNGAVVAAVIAGAVVAVGGGVLVARGRRQGSPS